MDSYTYCLDCDTTVDVDHFTDTGDCEFKDIREVLTEAQEYAKRNQV